MSAGMACGLRSGHLITNRTYSLTNRIIASEKQCRIQVTLQCVCTVRRVDALSCFIHTHAVIHTHDFRACFSHRWQQLASAHTEVDAWDYACDMLEDFRGVWQHVLAVVITIEIACPRVKELHGINACLDLNVEEVDNRWHQALHQCIPGLRIGVHESLGDFMVLRWATFNQVGSQGKWRAHKTDESLGIGEFIQNDLDAIGDFVDVVVQDWKIVDIGAGAYRFIHDWATAGNNVYADSCGAEWNNNIGEQDRRIDIMTADWLEGDFGEEFWHEARIQHRDAFACCAVFRK